MSKPKTNLNDYEFIFNIESKHWDDGPGWKKTVPVTLGEIIEGGLRTQLDFTDGGYLIAGEIDWNNDTVIVAKVGL